MYPQLETRMAPRQMKMPEKTEAEPEEHFSQRKRPELPAQVHAATTSEAIRPFHVNFPRAELSELRRRIKTIKVARPGDGCR
jgi:hypothetical protein